MTLMTVPGVSLITSATVMASFSKSERSKELSDDQIFTLLRYLISKGSFNFSFSGGEPLLRNKLSDFIRFVKGRRGKTTLLSNLTLLDNKKAKELIDSGVDYIRTSLEGDNASTHDYFRGDGNFDLVIDKMRLLSNTNIKKGISLTINKNNFRQLEGVVKILIKFNFSEFTFSLLAPLGRGKQLSDFALSKNKFKELLLKIESLKNKYSKKINFHCESPLTALSCYESGVDDYAKHSPCIVGRSFLGFKANGDIYACPMRDAVVIGNIEKNNIQDLWLSSPLLNKVRDLNQLKDKCRNCPIKINCGGGCRILSLVEFGDPCVPDPYCWR